MALPHHVEEEIKECFRLFDSEGLGMVSKEDLSKIVRNFANPTEKELDQMFREIDTDGVELRHMRAKKKIHVMFHGKGRGAFFNSKGSGDIKFDEFKTYFARHLYDPNRNEEQETREAFQIFDENGDGFIDLQELKNVMTKMGEEKLTDDEYSQMIKEVDLDFDGRINYNEFCRMMNEKFD